VDVAHSRCCLAGAATCFWTAGVCWGSPWIVLLLTVALWELPCTKAASLYQAALVQVCHAFLCCSCVVMMSGKVYSKWQPCGVTCIFLLLGQVGLGTVLSRQPVLALAAATHNIQDCFRLDTAHRLSGVDLDSRGDTHVVSSQSVGKGHRPLL